MDVASGSLTEFSFDFTYRTPNLNMGVEVDEWQPRAGDILYDAWCEVITAFNGTTPKADLYIADATQYGIFGTMAAGIDLTKADADMAAPSGVGNCLINIALANMSISNIAGHSGLRAAPSKITKSGPCKIVASQTSLLGGAPIGATQGEAIFHVVIIRKS